MTKLEKLLIPMICKGLTKSDFVGNTKFVDAYTTDKDKGLMVPALYLMYKFDPQDEETEKTSINLLYSNYSTRFMRVINGVHYNVFKYNLEQDKLHDVLATSIYMDTDEKLEYINFWGKGDEYVNDILSNSSVRCNTNDKLHSIPPEDYAPGLKDKHHLIIYK